MHVRISRSGGFAGFEQETVASFDTDSLPSAAAQQVENALAELSAAKDQPVGADMLRYDIEVEEQERHETYTVYDDGDPKNPIRRLLDSIH